MHSCYLKSDVFDILFWAGEENHIKIRRVGGSGFAKDSEILVLRSHVWGYPIWSCGWIGSSWVGRKTKASRGKHACVWWLRQAIFSKDVHIGVEVDWSCLKLQLVLFVLLKLAVQRQNFSLCRLIFHIVSTTFMGYILMHSQIS